MKDQYGVFFLVAARTDTLNTRKSRPREALLL